MPDFAWGYALPAILTGVVASFVLERLLNPTPDLPWRRSVGSVAVHIGLWLVLFVIEFLQFRRVWLAVVLTTSIWIVIVLVNNAKYRSLREPFIFQDFDYFIDAIRHPRLFLPFFGIFRIVTSLAAVIVALTVGVSLESPLTVLYEPFKAWLVIGTVALWSVVLLWCGSQRSAQLSFEPALDLRREGLLSLLWRYGLAERHPPAEFASRSSLLRCNATPQSRPESGAQSDSAADSGDVASHQPNIVVVQSESFFDPRRTYPVIKRDVLAGFDRICQQSCAYGQLEVAAWGANTVRTEFSFLTGIDAATLGIDRFNPYRRLVSAGVPSLASLLGQQGYRTVCVHPYPASFYHRDKIFPLLGFDEFIDIEQFEVPQIKGTFASDVAVTDQIIELLSLEHTQPLFVFVITMENHGPLHLETITAEQAGQWLRQSPLAGCEDLSVYLRHLANADCMMTRLTAALSEGARPGVLTWYGDHVPIMEKVYDRLEMPDGCTDYFIWRSDALASPAAGAPVRLPVHALAAATLQNA